MLVEDGSTSSDGYHIPGAGLSPEGAELIVAYAPITDSLIDAIRTRSSVSILHRGTPRTIDPWHVFMADGGWYPVGRDHAAGDQRVFALDAIESAETIGAKLEIEHVMPKGWRSYWGNGVAHDPELSAERDILINTIGNLTLVTQKLTVALTKRLGIGARRSLSTSRRNPTSARCVLGGKSRDGLFGTFRRGPLGEGDRVNR